MTESEIEILARKLCVASGDDPDGFILFRHPRLTSTGHPIVDKFNIIPGWRPFAGIAAEMLRLDNVSNQPSAA